MDNRFNNKNKSRSGKGYRRREIKQNKYLGRTVTLTVLRETESGVYLGDGEDREAEVLLPGREIPAGTKPGDKLKVFIYRDSEDRPIATVKEPYIKLDDIAALEVCDVNRTGAFLDWGLDKQLFLPYSEMTAELKPGDKALVRLYIDKSGRLCAGMRHLYEYMHRNCPYEAGETVKARVYEFGHDFGTFVAIEDRYSAMIPRKEGREGLKIGDVIDVKITGIKEDGKVDVTTRKRAFEEIESDAEKVMRVIDEFAGVLPFNDKASPETIFRELSMSKAAFKRAVGHLYKERRIIITENAIRKISD